MSNPPPPSGGLLASKLASNRLGVPAVVFFVLTAATPLTVVAGVVTTGFAMTGLIAIPIAFLVIGALLILFSAGYVAMARHIENAGAFYAFVARGIGRPVGVGAAWVALLSYCALAIGLYGLIGVAAAPLLEQWFGIGVAWWVPAFACWLIVSTLGLQAVDLNGKVLAVLLTLEIGVIAVFSVSNLFNPAENAGSVLTALSPGELFGSGTGALLVLAVLGFVGFEAATVYSEESRDPKRTVPTATYLSVAILAVLYGLASWAMTVATGSDNIVETSREQEIGVIFNLAGEQLGGTAVLIAEVLLVTSILAAAISFHNTVARYMFALGRERVLPSVLGRTSARTAAPMAASLVQSCVGGLVILVYAVAGLDPLVQLFFYAGTSGGLGVLLLITVTSIAVVAFFARDTRGEHVWRRLVAPISATVLLVAVSVAALVNFPDLLGTPEGSALPVAIPLAFAGAAVLGIAWGLILSSKKPQVYTRIGAGATAVLVEDTPAEAAEPVAQGGGR